MSSRDRILAAIKQNQPAALPLAEFVTPERAAQDLVQKLRTVVEGIGGAVLEVNDWPEISQQLSAKFPTAKRWINVIPEAGNIVVSSLDDDPHHLEDVTLAILKGHFAVAENGAVWVTDERMGDRALPFICEHLALVVNTADICPTLHEAYTRIGNSQHNFGTFIAGPSKTADIEQSLVLGAHGPKSMTLFLLRNG